MITLMSRRPADGGMTAVSLSGLPSRLSPASGSGVREENGGKAGKGCGRAKSGEAGREAAGDGNCEFLIFPGDVPEIEGAVTPCAVGEQTVCRIRESDGRCRAVLAAERLLEYGANSRYGLAVKLRKRGFSVGEAFFAADRMVEKGAVNELRDAEREIARIASKGCGRMRIEADLSAKGYSRETVAAMSDRISEIDFAGICRSVIRKKWGEMPSDPALRKKAVASLMRLGFSGSDIRGACSKKD